MQNFSQIIEKEKVSVSQSCPTLCNPLSTGFSRQEYWSGLPFPSPGDLSDSGIKPMSPVLQADSLPTELQGKPIMYFNFLENYTNLWLLTFIPSTYLFTVKIKN